MATFLLFQTIAEEQFVIKFKKGIICFQGAERKTRDEERRAAKRKMTATGRKKLDELYHPAQERSEFYSMADLLKPPVFFSPSEDLDKVIFRLMSLDGRLSCTVHVKSLLERSS